MTNSDQNKRFFLDQHGCAKNQVDGEILVTRLEKIGYVKTDDASQADFIIINSCGFISSAKEESLNAVIDARASYPDANILLAGCLAERYAQDLKNDLTEADGFFGNGDLSMIDGTVKSLLEGQRPVVVPPQEGVCCGDRNTLLSFNGSAYVKITEGCNNCCTFCAIPIIRGQLRSRKCSDIVAEISDLVHNRGIKEINLIGQDLAAFGCGKTDDVCGDGTNWHSAIFENLKTPVIEQDDFDSVNSGKSYLARLMEDISKIEGEFWVRLLYIHPDHFNKDILDVMKTDSRFLPYFDIPFQSGEDGVIKSMNRKGGFESYKKLVETIRQYFPEACIRTTFLTGFPGESEKSAERTKEFLKTIESDWSGCFEYSSEEGTPAAKMKGKVSSKVAQKRARALEDIQSSITESRLKNRLGKNYDVLIEEIIENNEGTDEGLAIGRAWFEAPEVDGSFVVRYDLDDPKSVAAVVPGKMVKARAVASSQVDVDGVLCESR